MRATWLTVVTGLLLAAPLAADEVTDPRQVREAEMAAAFRAGMERIVADMNAGSFERYVEAIDQDDLFERIFGLRLISPRLKRDWREDMEQDFSSFIAGIYYNEAKDGLKASLLQVESRGDLGRAVVRFDLSHFRVNYLEYELRLDENNKLIVVDWIDYMWGHRFSDWAGLQLIAAHPNPRAVRKLIDYPQVSESDVFQVTEVLKATRDRDLNKYFTIIEGLDDRLKRQEFVIMAGLDTAKMRRARRHQRVILEALASFYPDDPKYALSLIEYYFPARKYQEAYGALIRLRDHLNIDNDAVMNARLSSATLVLNQVADANAYAVRSVEQDPSLELGWWAVLRARVAAEQYAEAIEALTELESRYGHSLGPDELGKDRSFNKFLRSAEYGGWLQARATAGG